MSRFVKILIVLLVISVIGFFFMMGSVFNLFSSVNGDVWEYNPDVNKPHLSFLQIEGPIYSSETVLEWIDKIKTQENCKGILVRLETPGGAVAASQEIFHALKELRNESFEVVVSMGNTAASGGYYIALAGSKIFANSGTITGSVGVIAQFPEVYELMEKVGVKYSVVKSGSLKDSGSPFRKASQADLLYFQDVINNTFQQFLSDVKNNRDLSDSAITRISDGRVVTGSEAFRLGMVDTLGTLNDAKRYLAEKSGLGSAAKFIKPVRHLSWIEQLSEVSALKSPSAVSEIKNIFHSGLYYLWPVGMP